MGGDWGGGAQKRSLGGGGWLEDFLSYFVYFLWKYIFLVPHLEQPFQDSSNERPDHTLYHKKKKSRNNDTTTLPGAILIFPLYSLLLYNFPMVYEG